MSAKSCHCRLIQTNGEILDFNLPEFLQRIRLPKSTAGHELPETREFRFAWRSPITGDFWYEEIPE